MPNQVQRLGVTRLLSIPGVVSVGLGWKERAGAVLSEWAYRVHVTQKRPLDEIPEAERVPAAIDGIATDVVVADHWTLAGRQQAFLTPGCQIYRHVPSTEFPGPGTLTLLVERGGKHYALSCDHVYAAGERLQDNALDVYSPLHTSCDCRDPVARVQAIAVPGYDDMDPDPVSRSRKSFDIGGKKFWTDCALALISGQPAKGTNEITIPTNPSTKIHFDQGINDLSSMAFVTVTNAENQQPMRVNTTPVVVHKLGARSQYTTGVVTQLARTQYIGGEGLVDTWELVVVPVPGAPTWTQDFELVGDMPTVLASIAPKFVGKPVKLTLVGGQVIRLTGPVFALPGDSGAPVWDDNGKLIGIVTAAAGPTVKAKINGNVLDEVLLPTGAATLQYAHAAFAALGLTASSILAPGTPLAGEALAVPRPAAPLLELRDIEHLRRAVEETPGGMLLLELVTRHLEQVTQLVHHRRRVKVVWHRNRGPAFALAFAEAMRDPSRSLPSELSGVSFASALASFFDVLSLEGTESLKRDLRIHSSWLASLLTSSRTVGELLSDLRALPPAAPAPAPASA